MELKAKRKMKVLLLVEVALQDDAVLAEDDIFYGPHTLIARSGKGVCAWGPQHVASAIEEILKDRLPPGAESDDLWYVKSAKEATAS